MMHIAIVKSPVRKQCPKYYPIFTYFSNSGWSDYKVMHEIYTHLAARDLNARVREMENFYKENL